MAHLFHWYKNSLQVFSHRIIKFAKNYFCRYYPEGGWGWVVLLCACASRALAHGIQLGFAYPAAAMAARRFLPQSSNDLEQSLQMGESEKRGLFLRCFASGESRTFVRVGTLCECGGFGSLTVVPNERWKTVVVVFLLVSCVAVAL